MGYQPAALGQTPADVNQAVTDGIAAQVPPLIPKVTSSRLYVQPQVMPGDTLSATTAAEQSYASQYTVPANSMVVGQAVHINGAGIYSTPLVNLVSQRARLRLGGAVLIDASAQTFPVNLASCRYEFYIHYIVRSLGTAGTVEAFGRLIFATSLTTAVTVLCGPSGTTAGDAGNPVTVNTTVDNAIVLSCQFGGVQVGNSNSLRELSVHTLKPVT